MNSTLGSTMRTTRSRKVLPKRAAGGGMEKGPGPGAYRLPGSIGTQVEARRSSPTKMQFGTGPARASMKHAGDTPGPGAYKEPLFGEAVESTKVRAPNYTMRGRETFGSIDNDLLKMNTPGPGAYGRPNKPDEGTAAAYSLAKRTWRTKRRSSTPGPGRYKGPSSFGRQRESTIKSNGVFSFPRSKRPDLLRPSTTIGPGEYGTSSAVGKQLESKTKTKPSYSFGQSSRFAPPADARQIRAGPGSYILPDSVGKQVLSRYKSAGSFTLGGRTSFNSPYG